jgi:hypothetical protein
MSTCLRSRNVGSCPPAKDGTGVRGVLGPVPPPPPPPIDAPCTQCLRHGDPMHAQERLTAAAAAVSAPAPATPRCAAAAHQLRDTTGIIIEAQAHHEGSRSDIGADSSEITAVLQQLLGRSGCRPLGTGTQ